MSQEPTDSEAALAGQALSQWLPYGAVRKVLFSVALAFGGVGVLIGTASWYHYALIV
jgi:hypothetical protein